MFSDLDLTSYERTELSRGRRSEGGTSLPGRVEAATEVIMYMATLATDDNTRMGTEALHRVETQWGRPFQRVKEGINLLLCDQQESGGDEGLRGGVHKAF